MEAAIQEYRFQPQQTIVSGAGAVKQIPAHVEKLGRQRAFILTGKTLAAQTDLISNLEEALGDRFAGTFSGCVQHSLQSSVEAATEQASAAQADLLISFGGGSPIDTTKIVAFRLLGERPREDLPHFAVPTTLSAAEFTSGGGMTNADRIKEGIADRRMMPKSVFLDPEVTTATPRELWAATGIKALDHAIEALWSPRAHPVTDTLALEAIRRLHRNLPASLDPSDLEARLQCQIAAWMSIFGARNTGMRLSHPMGHQIGARWDIPHGVTSCIVLPIVMRFLAEETGRAQARIAEALGVSGAAEAAARAVESLIESLGVPTRISQFDAKREELPEVARAIFNELKVRGVRGAKVVEESQILGLLEEAW